MPRHFIVLSATPASAKQVIQVARRQWFVYCVLYCVLCKQIKAGSNSFPPPAQFNMNSFLPEYEGSIGKFLPTCAEQRDASPYFLNTRVWNRFLACSTIVYLRVRSCQTSSTSKLIFPGTDFSHALLKSTYVYVVVRLLVPNKIIFAGTDFSHALV